MRKSRDFVVREDQRKHKRFKAQGEVFAAFVMPNEPIIVGRVLDVSLSGVAVQYLATRKLEKGPASIKLFGLNSPPMERIESTVMYDLEIPEKSWINPKVRRCGIKFEKHSSGVKAQLKELCKTNPRGTAITDETFHQSRVRGGRPA